jgi:iron complex outermembrane receptor protein
MTKPTQARLEVLASASMMALALCAGLASIAHAAEAPATGPEKEVDAVVITALKGRAANVAPVSASLTATEPQAVITRKFIEESAPRVGDYTTTAILAPSMATTPNPNGSGATDGAKITMRGFQDGEFNVTYDGIAWGDTNGPSHHSNSFFPSSTIGGVVIDRGPGGATDLGQANFGGSVNLFSLPFEDKPSIRQTLTNGSFQTVQAVTTLASGPIAQLNGANVTANFMEYKTNGYLSNSSSDGYNQFLKIGVPLGEKFTLTALYTHNYDSYYQGDASANATVAQTELYGKRFALSDDPTLQTYKGYNFTKKETEFGYLRLEGELAEGLRVQNTAYEYWYSNKTLSGNDNGADASIGATALAAANKVILSPSVAYPAGGAGYASGLKVNGLPGYLKRNKYRVRGDILKFTKDFEVGTLTVGTEYELAKTGRSRFDVDLLTNGSDYREKAALVAGDSPCGDWARQSAPGKAWDGACQVPLNIAYNEYSGWHQYQPFAQFEWKPNDKLTVTPGVKYVHFKLYVDAPAVAVKGSIQPANVEGTFTKTLPFLTANYRIAPNWAVYGQYAQGFLVPSISIFYVNNPGSSKVVPQESTNYQIGTVFNAGKLTVDADAYYIDFKHKIQTQTDLATGETFQTNFGGATYKGVEVQATYVLPHDFSVFANGTVNQSTGKDDPLNPGYNGHQLAKAPRGTAAAGIRSERHDIFTQGDNLIVTVNDKLIGPQYGTAASGATPPTGLVKAFSQADLSATYHLGHYSLQAQVLNLFDTQDITSFKGKALLAGTNIPAETVAQGGAANVFTYQVGRSYQITLKAAF